jgi:hypothetical protein
VSATAASSARGPGDLHAFHPERSHQAKDRPHIPAQVRGRPERARRRISMDTWAAERKHRHVRIYNVPRRNQRAQYQAVA